jgi:peptide chain release factor 1
MFSVSLRLCGENFFMFEKLAQIEKSYEELTEQISQPEFMSDMSVYAKLMKQHRSLGEVVEKYREVRRMKEELAGAKEMADAADDEEMRELALAEAAEIEDKLPAAEEELKVLLLPKDPNDEKNVILEIRAGTGGDEATLFAAEVLRMYARYAERQGWKMEIMDAADTGVGGIKEAFAMIEGDNVYSKLRYESGVHRVQRVPQTESSGRIHTSAITVAVLPEAEEVDVQIDQNDLRIDTFCSSGARWTVGEHDLFRGAYHAFADEYCRFDAGRKIADKEPRKGNACSSCPAAGDRGAETTRRFSQRTQIDGRKRRPL